MVSYVKRLIRRGRTKVEDSIALKTKEGKIIRIKPLIITRGNTNKRVAHALREEARDFLSKYVSKQVFEQIIEDIVNNKLQRDMVLVLKKIYPIKMCVIREVKIETLRPGKGKLFKVRETKESEEKTPEESKTSEREETFAAS